MIKWLGRAFSEENGQPSSMRMLVFIVVIVILVNWTHYNLTFGAFVPLDWGSASALVGTLMAKAYQKSKEGGT